MLYAKLKNSSHFVRKYVFDLDQHVRGLLFINYRRVLQLVQRVYRLERQLAPEAFPKWGAVHDEILVSDPRRRELEDDLAIVGPCLPLPTVTVTSQGGAFHEFCTSC